MCVARALHISRPSILDGKCIDWADRGNVRVDIHRDRQLENKGVASAARRSHRKDDLTLIAISARPSLLADDFTCVRITSRVRRERRAEARALRTVEVRRARHAVAEGELVRGDRRVDRLRVLPRAVRRDGRTDRRGEDQLARAARVRLTVERLIVEDVHVKDEITLQRDARVQLIRSARARRRVTYQPAEFERQNDDVGALRRAEKVDAVAAENGRLVEAVRAFVVVARRRAVDVVQVRVLVAQAEANEGLARLNAGEETIGTVATGAVDVQAFAVDQPFQFDFEFTSTGAELQEKESKAQVGFGWFEGEVGGLYLHLKEESEASEEDIHHVHHERRD